MSSTFLPPDDGTTPDDQTTQDDQEATLATQDAPEAGTTATDDGEGDDAPADTAGTAASRTLVVDPDEEALKDPQTPTLRRTNAADEVEDESGYVGVSGEYRTAATHHFSPNPDEGGDDAADDES